MIREPDNDLFSGPIARNSDPATSHESAAEHEARGLRLRQCERLLWAIIENPGLTGRELSEHVTFDGAWKRVSDLYRAGSIVPCGVRPCTITGRRAQTWRVAPLRRVS